MRVIIVGLGVQGYKRLKYAGTDVVATVDPVNPEANFYSIQDVPLTQYDAALLCVPDKPKIELLTYLLSNGKHVLTEKPMWSGNDQDISNIEVLARDNKVVCYTAYNHRFEPHFVKMRNLIRSGELGKIYSCRMFYGNGTARLVRDSAWRDEGAGVLPDLGSHLLDTAVYWFGNLHNQFEVVSANCFENNAPDHVVIGSKDANLRIELEMTLLMWRNHFTCDILAEKGSAHISSLCKWGPTVFVKRSRVFPSGRPKEEVETIELSDPTWKLEYEHFTALCDGGHTTNLSHDLWLHQTLHTMSNDVIRMAI